MGKPTVGRLQELGLYDPAAADAEQRLGLLEFLISTGASAEDLLAYRDELPGLPFLLAMRGGDVVQVSGQDAAHGADAPREVMPDFLRYSTRGAAAGVADPSVM